MIIERTPKSIFIRLGRFEIYACRETVQPIFWIAREVPGEVVIDLPWFSVSLVNSRRTEAHFKDYQVRREM